ncbi:hypothetical protein FRACYDRAFT_182077 [Fragilariopsis cylindrus CCMP1102]|uniref:Nucleotide-diphospho-sugar transferase domain-containing protein n=1 Tax=Fragilariopsis cylindrus CCMP1102 TaxID=635003 RepID=A0A1E7FQ54_9STRA|nr:hypothetical protein FRACYDRAFT_182077 [Fragilariopsis cylindrus CCMP1102]|eukprot:OEU20300.1 hypothetical protein FRACYDRAFT_182077 [Fragilariopsis cylindrus CCMP1102]
MVRQRNNQNQNNQRTRYFLPRGEYVNRTDFHNTFSKQLGIPLDKNDMDNDRVLLLYSESKAYPKSNTNSNTNSNSEKSNIDDENGNRMIPLNDAIENCDFMHVVLTNPDRHKQCIAIMGQYESYHVHRFMRMPMPSKPQPINSSYPLRYVPRGMQQNGRITHKVPSNKYQTMYWNDLMNYKSSLVLSSKEDGSTDNNLSVMEELDPILRTVAATDGSNESNKNNNNNTVIILVCNFGQSELLMNFICNANSKGLSNLLNNIILFATDLETHELATSMGLHSYYSERIFSNMPKEAAKEYADDTFRLMMFAKVYCVHIVSQLGYDFLFQDVDVIWYKNPLDWFHNETNPDYHFDMFFQDDGSRALFYAPYAANTGFYYVRNNERTKYFFHSLLMSGDLIMATYSHQIALNTLLSEHVSIYGLSVKICDRNDIEFPGGYWYHERHDLMKQYIVSSSSSSSSSSLSWTDNKDNKVRFMEQMGEWYLEETCKSVSRNNIINNTAAAAAADHGIMNSNNSTGNSASTIRQHCCAVTPLMKCHYRDKPSRIPCHDSIPIDEDGKSFW